MNTYFKTKKVSLTAVKGKKEGEMPVELTVGKEKITLSKDETAELAEALIKRATGGVSATKPTDKEE